MGALGCGHPATGEAALSILEAGGNAYDAAIAAVAAACVAEPVLASLAGGGFLTAQPAEAPPRVYDFFVQTPAKAAAPLAEAGDLDFFPIQADFGTATQEFHIGLGSVATPGVVAGLFAIHRDLGRLPLAELFAPACALAREGPELRPIDAYLFSVVGPILIARAEGRALFTDGDGALLGAGARIRQPALADTLEALAREGEALFYRGELAASLAEACRDGGLLGRGDLERYEVIRREPLTRDYRGARLWTNPLPSTGGLLVAFKLALWEALADTEEAEAAFDDPARLADLCRVMGLAEQARADSGLDGEARHGEALELAGRLLGPEVVARYLRSAGRHPPSGRGTTHISIIDREGSLAALTLSNGEGCGTLLPGCGIMLNNMLGEADLNAGGFHAWQPDTRLASMMAPSVARLADGSLVALGSGGSNRIRTALFQVLLNLADLGMSLEQAVEAPRLHLEDGLANAEKDLAGPLAAALEAADSPFAGEVKPWPAHNLFFGGAHLAARRPDGGLEAAGDPRRGGVGLTL